MPPRSDPAGYYRALGVPRTASAEEIRHAFRERAMASHPDRAGEAADGETFRLVREAYEVLRDPVRRMAYDASGLSALDAERRAGARSARPQPGFADDLEPGPSRPNGAAPPGRSAPDEAAPSEPEAAADGFTGANWARDAAAGAAWTTGFGSRRSGSGRRSRPAGLAGGTTLWLGLAAGALGFALLFALGSLWSTNRQLADREALLADAYGRLARLGEAQAELEARYRSLAFLDLERALQRGSWLSQAAPLPEAADRTVQADWARAAHLHEITFPAGQAEFGLEQEQTLGRALFDIAARIDRLPSEADWLIVLEAQAARAARDEQVAVESWEPALLRLATVLDAILAHGLPSERFAVRFNAGFAPLPRRAAATEETAYDRVLIKLVCCGP